MTIALDFEKPVLELERKLTELRHVAASGDLNIVDEIARLEHKTQRLLQTIYSKLTPWQKVMVARHGERPHAIDYIARLIKDFVPLAGDRNFGEDPALLSGIGSFRGVPVFLLGHEKGHDTETRVYRNFGMARPEGYRKAIRLMKLASRFGLPILTFVDTAGAHPGADAEERGQSEAIASCIEACFQAEVPLISTIIGEGGSGGAVALATANVVLMLEFSIYSVISPEGCASILWRTRDKREEAATAQKMTAADLLRFKVIDEIIPEPLGGAHRNRVAAVDMVGDTIEKHLNTLLTKNGKTLKEERRLKFLKMGRNL
ncbi:MAG: acetyl-CoA carboxylase carboxyltransferase subunit alpha [Alphaproteobacteria bacterium]